jgi:hypothetical protein
MTASPQRYRVRFTPERVEPPVWRRVLVRDYLSAYHWNHVQTLTNDNFVRLRGG